MRLFRISILLLEALLVAQLSFVLPADRERTGVAGTLQQVDNDGVETFLLDCGEEGNYILLPASFGPELRSLAGRSIYAEGFLRSAGEQRFLELAAVPLAIRETSPAGGSKPGIRLGNIVVVVMGAREEIEDIESERLQARSVPDLAEALSDERIEIQMIRKGGFGNEISMRGFGQENMKILLDGGLLEGACGSRKDPALSHIGMPIVAGINIQQGPFDVTKPGALGGYADVITRKPGPGFAGTVFGKTGSYGYRSGGSVIEGGSGRVQGLAGYNYSKAGQYRDGDGHSLWEAREGMAAPFTEASRDLNSFSKNDFWAKLRFLPGERQILLLEHSYGRAMDILTPRATADTHKEITNLSKVSWELNDSGPLSRKLSLSAYRNEVEHYPFQDFRAVAAPKNNIVKSTITGGSVQNISVTGFALLTYGLDFFRRDWRGDVYDSLSGQTANGNLIPSVESLNFGGYLQADVQWRRLSLSGGMRFDRFRQEAGEALVFTRSATAENRQVDTMASGQISARCYLGGGTEFFSGIGRSHRAPTSIERYIQGNPSFFGNPLLKPVSNTEFDAGLRFVRGIMALQAKGFHSSLRDYIYQVNTGSGIRGYANIDAHLYGGDISAEVRILPAISLEAGLAGQRGRKDTFPENNTDRDLGQIAPVRSRVVLRFSPGASPPEEMRGLSGSIEWIRSGEARHIDSQAGEKQLQGWDTLNFQAGYAWKSFTLNIGGDNLLDRHYAVVNSYEWDVIGGTGANPAIIYEPGRSLHASLDFKF